MWWLRFFEAWAIQKLLGSSAFHRGVRLVERKVEHIRTGKAPADLEGGTSLDDPKRPTFLKHFAEEVQAQLRGGNSKK